MVSRNADCHSGRMARRHLEHRIVAQRRAVVGVLVARRNCKHPQPQHLFQRMHDACRSATVLQAAGQPIRQPKPLLDATQQKNAAIGRQKAPSKATFTFLRQTAGTENGSRLSSSMAGVALRDRSYETASQQNHPMNLEGSVRSRGTDSGQGRDERPH